MPPMIYENTDNGVVKCDIYSRLVQDRIIFLCDEIDVKLASDTIAILLYLDRQDPKEDITVYINCPGASLSDGFFAIYDTFQYISAPISTICAGEACSGGAFLLAAGTKGKRFAFPNSQIMIHNVQVSEISGSKIEVEAEIKRLKEWNKVLLEVFARHTGNTLAKVTEDCANDYYMNAKEALKYGIIDRIIKPKKVIPRLKARKSAKVKR